jgi:hypothetical protein
MQSPVSEENEYHCHILAMGGADASMCSWKGMGPLKPLEMVAPKKEPNYFV